MVQGILSAYAQLEFERIVNVDRVGHESVVNEKICVVASAVENGHLFVSVDVPVGKANRTLSLVIEISAVLKG